MATQPLTGNLVLSTTRHPNTSSPEGQKIYTLASVKRSDASGPYLKYSKPAKGYEAASTRIVQVPPEVAAADLAWVAEGTCVLATDQEVTDALAAKQTAYEAETRSH
jgi:hypothetical protein